MCAFNSLMPNNAYVEQVSFNDQEIKTNYIGYKSDNSNGEIKRGIS